MIGEHIGEENIAVDAGHFEARDCAQASKREKPEPKKLGRKSKAERDQWLKEKHAREDALRIYEKEIVHQLTESVETLFDRPQMGSQDEQRREKRLLGRLQGSSGASVHRSIISLRA